MPCCVEQAQNSDIPLLNCIQGCSPDMTAIPHSLLNISLKSETLFFNRVPPFQRTKGLLPPEHEKKSWRLSLLLHSCFALYWRIRMHLKRHFICVIRHAEWEIALSSSHFIIHESFSSVLPGHSLFLSSSPWITQKKTFVGRKMASRFW